MQEVDINELVAHGCLVKNIPEDIIIKGRTSYLKIKYRYEKLNLSKLFCTELRYYNQIDESIKNHILPNSLKCLDCSNNKLTSIPDWVDFAPLSPTTKFIRIFNL